MLILPTESSKNLAHRVAEHIGAKVVNVEKKVFPDGEIYVRAMQPLDGSVVVMGNSYPNDSFIELLFLQDLASESSNITTVVPYFGYSRQDRRFLNGECIAAKSVANLLETKCDSIITVNLHKDYVRDYFTRAKAINLLPSREIAGTGIGADIVLSPDIGSFYLAEAVARDIDAKASHFDKKRISSTEIISSLDEDVDGMSVLLVDDIISTGTTIIKSCETLRARGAKRIDVTCVHGLFLRGSERMVNQCDSVNASDTIESELSDYTVSKLIADALLELEDV
jgi:ribose-phosphate pyrophosphokinase